MKTASQLTSAIENVKPEAIGRAHLILCATGNFYKVQSSRDETVEYAVRWSKEHGFTCECESGQHGFSNCKNGVCSHVLIALACKREEVEAVNELNKQIAEQASKAPAKKVSKAKAYQPKDFSTVLLHR
jgi:hypothetical protein